MVERPKKGANKTQQNKTTNPVVVVSPVLVQLAGRSPAHVQRHVIWVHPERARPHHELGRRNSALAPLGNETGTQTTTAHVAASVSLRESVLWRACSRSIAAADVDAERERDEPRDAAGAASAAVVGSVRVDALADAASDSAGGGVVSRSITTTWRNR